MDFEHLIQLIKEYGAWSYPVTFAGSFIEGESFVLAAAFLASQGLLYLPLVIATAWLGSACNDQGFFWIGRRYGLKLLERRPLWRNRIDRALSWLRRFDAGFILSYRFIYGIRNFSSVALGISGIAWRRFSLLNVTAAGLWTILYSCGGYFCGRALHSVLGNLAETLAIGLLGLVAAGGIGLLVARQIRHRRQLAAGTAPSTIPSGQ